MTFTLTHFPLISRTLKKSSTLQITFLYFPFNISSIFSESRRNNKNTTSWSLLPFLPLSPSVKWIYTPFFHISLYPSGFLFSPNKQSTGFVFAGKLIFIINLTTMQHKVHKNNIKKILQNCRAALYTPPYSILFKRHSFFSQEYS